MAFVDELQVHIKSGKGGDGVVRWFTQRGKPNGGPSGGNGGNGGDVYIRATRDTNILYKYRYQKEFAADNGIDGDKNSMHGHAGKDLFIDLPIGSLIKNLETDEEYELLKDGEEILILKGGRGGLGNEHFKSSTNRTPDQSTPGKVGEEGEFYIEIRLVADIGFLGLPSAGKSSLLNALTNTQAKVAEYPFTTLDPNLGNLYGVILADIPGIIEGASEGKGLGHKFLRHISRTGLLLHCISVENENVKEVYETIRKELGNFDKTLLDKEEIILLTKTDLVDEKTLKEKIKELGGFKKEIKTITILDDDTLKELSDFLVKKIKN